MTLRGFLGSATCYAGSTGRKRPRADIVAYFKHGCDAKRMSKGLMYWRSQIRLAPTLLVVLGSVLSAFIFAGCSTPTIVVFANGMSHNVVVTYRDDQHRIVEVDVAPNSSFEITHLLDTHFSIRTSQSTLSHERVDVLEEYIYGKGFGPYFKRMVKAQLEPDGCVYLYGKKDELLALKPPTQPLNFPLCGR
ncbi:hypothetical protein [Massilia sp. 9096]|uniref:hypothetical protein n=1 Tax=Massilia sp. 9096 TaxID=1500894 RepID=UPI0012E04DD6|nr:hypothetical protein [Massilia sp. 9096]